MINCPGCGAELDAHMKQCWECHEPIDAASSKDDEDELDHHDDDLDLHAGKSKNGSSARVAAKTAAVPDDLEDVADALLAGKDPEPEEEAEVELIDESQLPDTAVVAYVAQDEVQAGAISQLLSDCGIKNYATSSGDDEQDEDAGSILQVQVLKEDLASAQQLINDFTAEFDDFS